MSRANPLIHAMVAVSCTLAALVVLGTGLHYAESARQKLVKERSERSEFIMACIRHQQIGTCRVLHRMTQELRARNLRPSSHLALATP
jgi:hypothetical protein